MKQRRCLAALGLALAVGCSQASGGHDDDASDAPTDRGTTPDGARDAPREVIVIGGGGARATPTSTPTRRGPGRRRPRGPGRGRRRRLGRGRQRGERRRHGGAALFDLPRANSHVHGAVGPRDGRAPRREQQPRRELSGGRPHRRARRVLHDEAHAGGDRRHSRHGDGRDAGRAAHGPLQRFDLGGRLRAGPRARRPAHGGRRILVRRGLPRPTAGRHDGGRGGDGGRGILLRRRVELPGGRQRRRGHRRLERGRRRQHRRRDPARERPARSSRRGHVHRRDRHVRHRPADAGELHAQRHHGVAAAELDLRHADPAGLGPGRLRSVPGSRGRAVVGLRQLGVGVVLLGGRAARTAAHGARHTQAGRSGLDAAPRGLHGVLVERVVPHGGSQLLGDHAAARLD